MANHDLSHIVAFARVAETRSFTAAARQLGMSKATVSKQVARLETELGARLLHRTTRSIGLTDVGVRFQRHCRLILDELTTATQEIAAAASRGHRLRIGIPECLGYRFLLDSLGKFLERRPTVDLEVVIGGDRLDPVAFDLDLAIQATPVSSAGLRRRRLAPCPVIYCAAPAYLQRRGRPRCLADIAAHDCLSGAAGGVDACQSGAQEGVTMIRGAMRLRANSGELVRSAALSGLRVARLALPLVARDLAEGRLEQVLPEHEDRSLWIVLVRPDAQEPTRDMRDLVAQLAEVFAPGDAFAPVPAEA